MGHQEFHRVSLEEPLPADLELATVHLNANQTVHLLNTHRGDPTPPLAPSAEATTLFAQVAHLNPF